MENIQAQVAEAQRLQFLKRINTVAAGDSHRWVPAGLVGTELALPYEAALRIIDELREAGLVRRGGGGRLEPPIGPRIQITEAGIARATAEADQAQRPQPRPAPPRRRNRESAGT